VLRNLGNQGISAYKWRNGAENVIPYLQGILGNTWEKAGNDGLGENFTDKTIDKQIENKDNSITERKGD